MQDEAYKYWAFVSYSHRDQVWAEWLHRALETYRVPRRLVGRDSAAGPLPRRLFPVFRDQEELPSSPSLSGAIDQALQQSRYLIVIASPYAAVSKWVDQEIARFRALGRSDRILCLIVDGEPHAHLQPGKGLLECFPPELRVDGFEPIGADLRHGRDGKPAAKLKLIAGILGVGLDELRRRELRRKRAQRFGLAVLCLVSAATLFGLWQAQQRDKREALAQQQLLVHTRAMYEKGRQELLAHNQARAAVYLNEAYRLGTDTPALRFMLARAMRIVETERLSFQTGSAVMSLKFSPDASRLYTRGADGLNRMWDAVNGRKLFELQLPSHAYKALRFSRNSRFLSSTVIPNDATVGEYRLMDAGNGRELVKLANAAVFTGTLNMVDRSGSRVLHLAPGRIAELVDLASGEVVRRLPGAYSIAGFSRDGRRILTGTDDGVVALWNADGSLKLRSFTGLHTAIEKIDDTEDGSLVAAAARDGSIRAWQVADGALKVLGGHPSPEPWLIFNLDGSRLFTGAHDGVRVWNSANGALVYALQFVASNLGARSDLSSDGHWLLTSDHAQLSMRDVRSGAELFTLDGQVGLPAARDISDDDRFVATGGSDGRVVIWNMPRIPDFEYPHTVDPLRWNKRWPPGVAAVYSHDGRLIASGAADGLLKLWDTQQRRLVRSVVADPQSVNLAEFSVDDRRLLSAGESSGVKIWDVGSGALIRALDCGGDEVLSASLSGDGRHAAATTLGGVTRLWDVESGGLLQSFKDQSAIVSRFSLDGQGLVIDANGSVKLWHIGQGRFVWATALESLHKGGRQHVSAFEFSADGARLLVATDAGAAYMLDAKDGSVLRTMHEPAASSLLNVGFMGNGELAAMGDDGGQAIIWRPQDGRTWLLQGHSGKVYSASFSPDGRFVLTSGVDATARIWDTDSGELLDVVGEHASAMPEPPFHAAEFRPDGKALLTGSTDGVVREWELGQESRSPEQLREILRCRVPWRVEGESLVPVDPDTNSCPAP